MSSKGKQIKYFCFSLLIHFQLPFYGQTLPLRLTILSLPKTEAYTSAMVWDITCFALVSSIQGLQKETKEFLSATGSK